MGRITPSFRQMFRQELHDLQMFRDALRSLELKQAYDSLKKAWSFNQATMMYAEIPGVLDNLLFMSVIDNRRLILELMELIEKIIEDKNIGTMNLMKPKHMKTSQKSDERLPHKEVAHKPG